MFNELIVLWSFGIHCAFAVAAIPTYLDDGFFEVRPSNFEEFSKGEIPSLFLPKHLPPRQILLTGRIIPDGVFNDPHFRTSDALGFSLSEHERRPQWAYLVDVNYRFREDLRQSIFVVLMKNEVISIEIDGFHLVPLARIFAPAFMAEDEGHMYFFIPTLTSYNEPSEVFPGILTFKRSHPGSSFELTTPNEPESWQRALSKLSDIEFSRETKDYFCSSRSKISRDFWTHNLNAKC